MIKKGVERKLVVVLFVLVLVAFSFAQRDSKELERMYTTTQLLKKGDSPAVHLDHSPARPR